MTGEVPKEGLEKEIGDLLEEFDSRRLPLMLFMHRAHEIRDKYGGFTKDSRLGKAVVASMERHTGGRDLMACLLDIMGFDVMVTDIDLPMSGIVEQCKDPEVKALCVSVQMIHECRAVLDLADMLKEAGIRDRIVYNAGGFAVTEEVAKQAGCDVFSLRATEAVKMIKEEVLRKNGY